MYNIVLIGMMGCGKTTVGRLLSQALDRPLVDTDQLIEEEAGCSVAQIFARRGETHFRQLELDLSRRLSDPRGLVIACGGGLPMQSACMDALSAGGKVFWLDRDPGDTFDSLDTSGRPLAQAGREDFVARYAARAPIYRRWAHHIIRAPSPAAGAEAIIHIMRQEENTP